MAREEGSFVYPGVVSVLLWHLVHFLSVPQKSEAAGGGLGAGDRLGGGGGKYVPPNQRGKMKDTGDSMMSSRMQQGFSALTFVCVKDNYQYQSYHRLCGIIKALANTIIMDCCPLEVCIIMSV